MTATNTKFKRDNTRYGKRHTPGEMNKTEAAYAELLHIRFAAGEVLLWEFEAMTFRLAADCRYTPDFMVQLKDGSIEYIDVKGGGPINEASVVKIRVAAKHYSMFTFAIEQLTAKEGWKRREF